MPVQVAAAPHQDDPRSKVTAAVQRLIDEPAGAFGADAVEARSLAVYTATPARAAERVRELGGTVDGVFDGVLEVRAPVHAISRIAADRLVQYIALPGRVRAAAVSEGVSFTEATTWHSAGLDGAGVKVGIVDVGFAGLDKQIRAREVPAALRVNYCSDFSGDQHGTAVAEIVHDVAPGAELHLICIDDNLDLLKAVKYAKSKKLDIVTMSASFVTSSRGDGRGGPSTPEGAVADATRAGILWVNSAGNYGAGHWSGTFKDEDGTGWHDFAPGDELNDFELGPGQSLTASLKWDEWPKGRTNFDLYLYRLPSFTRVMWSASPQGTALPPLEEFSYTNTGPASRFGLAISRAAGTRSPRMDLYARNADLTHAVAAGSIAEPATSASALAVGAMCWESNSIASYSSQGPTIDGRTKPDITGPASVSTETYRDADGCFGGFPGTSASAPHVAGVAALAKQAYPDLDVAGLRSYLEDNALDRGTRGKDNTYGAGSLRLAAVPAEPVTPSPRVSAKPTKTPRPTATPRPGKTAAPSATPKPTKTPKPKPPTKPRTGFYGTVTKASSTDRLEDVCVRLALYLGCAAYTDTFGNYTVDLRSSGISADTFVTLYFSKEGHETATYKRKLNGATRLNVSLRAVKAGRTAAPTATPTPRPAATPTPTRVVTPTPTPAALTIWDIDGLATLEAADGTYLGLVSSNKYIHGSICNQFGPYGGAYGHESVRNEYGPYGSPYGSDSAYNPYAFDPPAIVYFGRVVGYLTKNDYLRGALDPDILFAWYDCVY